MDGGTDPDGSIDAEVAAHCPEETPTSGQACDPVLVPECFYGEDVCCGYSFTTTTCYCDPIGVFNCWETAFCETCLDPVTCLRADGVFDCYFQTEQLDCVSTGACIWYPPQPDYPDGHCTWALCGDLDSAQCSAGDACIWNDLLELCYQRTSDYPSGCER